MRRVALLTVAMVTLLGCVGVAHAVGPITFDELPVGTVVDNQYASLGVVFLPGDVTGMLPIISMNGAMPAAPVLSPQGQYTPPQYWQYAGDFWMEFVQPVTSVQFISGYWDTPATGQIDLFDPGGGLITTATNAGMGPETMSFSGLGNIKKIYFNSLYDGAGADIDNLQFTPVPEPGTLALLCLGGTGLLAGFRRRCRN